MMVRKKLSSGIETLERRAAPSTLLGTGIALDFLRHGTGLESKVEALSFGVKQVESGLVTRFTSDWSVKPGGEAPAGLAAKPQAILDAVFAARSAAGKGLSDGTGQHAGARSVDKDTAEVLNFPAGNDLIEGASSTLRRTPNGISWTSKSNELQAGHAHTLWVVAFNNPEACVNGCGLDDLARPDVAATLAFGGGHVVGPSGSATFAGYLQEGDTSGFPSDSPFAGVVGGEQLGLVDSSQAEIHLVLRDHGEVIPGRVSEQLGTFSGACDVNACANVQFAAHQP